jgi:hypothetical protein
MGLHRRFFEVQLLSNLENHCIPRITFSFHPYRSSWTVNRKQFPLTTFNGWQVLSLSRTVLDLLLFTVNYILRYPESHAALICRSKQEI